MKAIAAEWNTTDATIADGPRRASGCIVKRVMVREDLIRPVNPSLFGLPDSHCMRGQLHVPGEVLLMPSLTPGPAELHPGLVTAVTSRDPEAAVAKRSFKYARSFITRQEQTGRQRHLSHFSRVCAFRPAFHPSDFTLSYR